MILRSPFRGRLHALYLRAKRVGWADCARSATMSPVILAPRMRKLLGTMASRCVPWMVIACCRAIALAGPLAVHLGVEFTLAPGQGAEAAEVGTPATRVRFVRVIEDGRCPHDINCAVTKPVGLEVEIVESGRAAMERLAIYERDSRQPGARSCVEVGKVALRLQDVEPWPSAGRKIPASEYRATFLLGSGCESRTKTNR